GLLVTRHAIAAAKFQIGEPVDIFHKGFVNDPPADTRGREQTIAVVSAKTRASVVAQGDRCQPSVIPGIVQLAEIRQQPVSGGGAVSRGDPRTRRQLEIIVRLYGKTLLIILPGDIVSRDSLGTAKDIQPALPEFQVVIRGIGPGQV